MDKLDIDRGNILDSNQREKLKDLMMKHKDIFSTGDTDIGKCNKVKHSGLTHEIPFKMRHYRIPQT